MQGRSISKVSVKLGNPAKKKIVEKTTTSENRDSRQENNLIPVDPAGGHRYWNTIKACESRGVSPRRTAE